MEVLSVRLLIAVAMIAFSAVAAPALESNQLPVEEQPDSKPSLGQCQHDQDLPSGTAFKRVLNLVRYFENPCTIQEADPESQATNTDPVEGKRQPFLGLSIPKISRPEKGFRQDRLSIFGDIMNNDKGVQPNAEKPTHQFEFNAKDTRRCGQSELFSTSRRGNQKRSPGTKTPSRRKQTVC
uniref:RxLR effector protein n=1 Tax=Spongospora subterranea TaxID=70186 RepID=A0A0H5R4L1_9EUKA|eukprot:CRZ08826.1 hypothetical protein [Spongospora subterranea]